MVAHEKHEGNEGEDGDQGASPPAIFLFKTFDTSLERFRGPRTSSAGCFLRHDFTSLAGPHLKRFKSKLTTTALLFSSAQVGVPYQCGYQANRSKGERPPFTCEVLAKQPHAADSWIIFEKRILICAAKWVWACR
jgi:hypothetical protein